MPTLGKLTEKQFMAQVVQLASHLGWRHYHTFDSRRSTAGFPDLFLVRRDRAIAAELKVGKRPVTHEQAEWIRALEAAGIMAYVWRETDWEAIERVLR